MVRQWQELFHAEKYSFTNIGDTNPDFVKLGEAFGIPSYVTDNPNTVDDILEEALKVEDGPVLVEFKVVKEDMVFPMVPAGGCTSQMLTRKINSKVAV